MTYRWVVWALTGFVWLLWCGVAIGMSAAAVLVVRGWRRRPSARARAIAAAAGQLSPAQARLRAVVTLLAARELAAGNVEQTVRGWLPASCGPGSGLQPLHNLFQTLDRNSVAIAGAEHLVLNLVDWPHPDPAALAIVVNRLGDVVPSQLHTAVDRVIQYALEGQGAADLHAAAMAALTTFGEELLKGAGEIFHAIPHAAPEVFEKVGEAVIAGAAEGKVKFAELAAQSPDLIEAAHQMGSAVTAAGHGVAEAGDGMAEAGHGVAELTRATDAILAEAHHGYLQDIGTPHTDGPAYTRALTAVGVSVRDATAQQARLARNLASSPSLPAADRQRLTDALDRVDVALDTAGRHFAGGQPLLGLAALGGAPVPVEQQHRSAYRTSCQRAADAVEHLGQRRNTILLHWVSRAAGSFQTRTRMVADQVEPLYADFSAKQRRLKERRLKARIDTAAAAAAAAAAAKRDRDALG